jgi:formyltetrahydrofolate synthetase
MNAFNFFLSSRWRMKSFLSIVSPVPSDIAIAQSVEPVHIQKIGEAAGILENELLPYGPLKAKVDLKVLDRLRDSPNGKYVVVTGINPTPLGEGIPSASLLENLINLIVGKSTTTVGLTQSLGAHLNRKVIHISFSQT